MWQGIFIVAIGGGIGAVSRYGLSLGVQRLAGAEWGFLATFIVNALGCLAFGFLAAVLDARLQLSPHYRLALLTGLLGAFTTFSTYAYDSAQLFVQGRYVAGGINMVGQVVVGMALLIAGMALAVKLVGPAATT